MSHELEQLIDGPNIIRFIKAHMNSVDLAYGKNVNRKIVQRWSEGRQKPRETPSYMDVCCFGILIK